MEVVLIILWGIALVSQGIYTSVIITSKAEGEGAGAFKWIIVASFILTIAMLILLGVRVWFLN